MQAHGPRIKQTINGDSSVYHLHMLLVENIKNKPTKNLVEYKNIEIVSASRRDEMTDLGEFALKVCKGLNQNPDLRALFEKTSPLSQTHQRQLYECINEFMNTCPEKDFRRFLYDKILFSRNLININFVQKLGLNLEDALRNEYRSEYGYNEPVTLKDFENLSIIDQFFLSEILANNIQAEGLGLKKSSWTVADNIDTLITRLYKDGPISMYGFGKNTFNQEPSLLQKMGDYDIYGWNPEAKKVDKMVGNMKFLDSSLVVGATEKDVLFINPDEDSDPNTPRKLYVIPYKTVCENVVDLHARTQEQIKPGFSAGYGYHADLKGTAKPKK